MSTETEVVEQVDQSETEALASAMAGYNARGSNTPPADEQANEPEAPETNDQTDIQSEAQVEEVPVVDEKMSALEQQLAALKQEVKARSSEYSPDAVRKMNGDIGDINRRLKALEPQPKPADAPVDDELTAALNLAEQAGKDFPELAGPLVAALRVMGNKASQPAPTQSAPAMSAEEISALAQQAATKAADEARVAMAQEALAEEHPDWTTVRNTPQFQTWFATKPAEYQERLNTTWNPAVVSRSLSEYKESLRAKQQKQDRLTSAITPRGVPTPPTPSKLSDDEGFTRGYNKGAPRPLHKR